MKKRIISFLLALVMAVSLLPVSAFAAGDAPVKVSYTSEGQSTEVSVSLTKLEGYDAGGKLAIYKVILPANAESITFSELPNDVQGVVDASYGLFMECDENRQVAISLEGFGDDTSNWKYYKCRKLKVDSLAQMITS